ncbi:hypothetical protein GS439_06780 [Rhodococcus hoagii]|nr:hypothetical protein [Prescottella equi]
MRLLIQVFGHSLELHIGRSESDEPVTTDMLAATKDNLASQVEFGFQPPEPWRYPEERWVES